MSFTLPDLIIENSIRNGLNTIRQAALQPDALTNPRSTIAQIIDVLFDFSQDGILGPGGVNDGGLGTLASKYTFEKTRLITFFRDTEVAIVQSFSDVQTHLPCVSIQLQADGEDPGLALTDDFGGLEIATTTNPVGRDENTIHANATINVGIHTKEQLLTKYLYHVVKYTVLSNKLELIRQNFIIATFRGSDFNRDAGWQGDHVYTRFLNISGKTEDSWIDIEEIAVNLEQVDLGILVEQNVTPLQQAASEVNATLPIGTTEIQVANSFYFPTSGMVTITTVGPMIDTSVTPNRIINPVATLTTEEIQIIGNNPSTNILTVVSTGTVQLHSVIAATPTIPETRTYVFNGTGAVTLNAQVIQTPPSPIQTSGNRQQINDADGVLHRSDINGQQT